MTNATLRRSLGAAGALLCLAGATGAAQNTVDHIASISSTAIGSGMFAPGVAGARGRGAGAPVTRELVSAEALTLASGSPAEQAVGFVLRGGSTAGLEAELTGAGAPAGKAASLMTFLSALAYSPTSASWGEATNAYNSLVKAAPATFINDPPAPFLAIRAALIAIWKAR